MELPDYNAPKEELLTFLTEWQNKYTRSDNMWYEINSWMAVVSNDGSRGKRFLFNAGDRERLFKWLKNLQSK